MSKTRLEQTFQDILKRGDRLFVPYIMAGDGGLDVLNDRLHFLETAGASAVELGIPFSDPVADGKVIQEAGQRALSSGTTVQGIFDTLHQSKDRMIPVILMTYINPVFIYGIEAFAKQCVKTGVSGVIVPDLPMEEETRLTTVFKDYDIALIRLVSLTSTPERRATLKVRAEGFLYAVTVTGTTGERETFTSRVETYLKELKEGMKVPVLAGFGISTPEHVKTLSRYADGVIVGSKIVQYFEEGSYDEIKALIDASKNVGNE